jgi:hypothetical protein
VLGKTWIEIPSLPSWAHHRSTGPSFDALCACVPLAISSNVHIVLDVLPRSLCGWPRISLRQRILRPLGLLHCTVHIHIPYLCI